VSVEAFISHRVLRHHIGGFGDDELRRILVRAGAIRTMSKSGQELWILVERMIEYTKSNHAFIWKIDKDPAAPPENQLFPAALPNSTSSADNAKGPKYPRAEA
jgi:hypothetical protein